MKILVPIKRVPDPDQKIRIREDASGIDESQMSFVMNPFDAIAAEEAVRIRAEDRQPEVEILAVTIGPGASAEGENELREALAMGADRAILVPCEQALDPWNVAQTLKALVERERPDLVLMGKQAIDDDANQAGQFLAALLDWPQATFASRIEFSEERLLVARETDAGLATVRVSLPAVITTELRLNEPRYAPLSSIMRAKRNPLDRIGLDELGVTIEPRVQLLHMELASTQRQCATVDSVDELVDRLRNEAGVI
jgi:electron transfer flavoprotein beta subunit